MVFGITGIGQGDDVSPLGELEEGQAPVGEGHAWASLELAREGPVLFQECGNHRLGGYLVELEDEGVDEDYEDGRETEGVNPLEGSSEKALFAVFGEALLAQDLVADFGVPDEAESRVG